ncbi:MAG: GldG family protein [Nitrosomonadales bacterium]|nr:GldG family protein [Nitrosomonadales bacterium]
MNKLLLKNLAFAALLLAATVALYQLAARHPAQWDMTQSASNSLETSSVDVLKQLPGGVKLTVYATGQDAQLGDIRKLIRDFVALYQRYKPDVKLSFVDPVKQPEEARKVNIQANGEMLVEYGGRSEHLTLLSEQALTSALLRLAHSKDKLLMHLDGHGERRLEGIANHDLGEFGKKLQQNGFRLGSLNLTLAQGVPSNTSTLIITQPQLDLLPGEVDKLLRYIADGGNLLWLVDAEPLHGLERLAENLGLLLTPGIVIDPAAEEMRAPATWALGAGYPPHAVTHNFNLITVFPNARAIGWEESAEWQHTMLVEAAPRGWVSNRTPQNKPRFDKNNDVPGPVTIALALQRNINDREQRIIIVGSGSFLANAYSGNGGNLDLGVNMVNWLSNEEKLITIQPRAVKDGAVSLSKTRLAIISGGLLIALPMLLVLVGGVMWWRRRQ